MDNTNEPVTNEPVWKKAWGNPKARMIFFAVVIFLIGVVANHYGSIYATERASNSVSDIILSNISVVDVDGTFVFGPIVLWAFLVGLMFYRPAKAPFALKALGLLLVTRAIFVTLTHIGPFPDTTSVDYSFFRFFTQGSDLFFSGHTAIPFMAALIYWEDIRLRLIFLATSVLFAVVVLLGHYHYTIDVAAAFFITYSVYHLATIFFKGSFKVFREGFN